MLYFIIYYNIITNSKINRGSTQIDLMLIESSKIKSAFFFQIYSLCPMNISNPNSEKFIRTIARTPCNLLGHYFWRAKFFNKNAANLNSECLLNLLEEYLANGRN